VYDVNYRKEGDGYMFEKKIAKEDVMKLPLKRFGGRIVLIDNKKDLNRYIQVIRDEAVWGFDTETRPSFKKGRINKPALIQFANAAYAFLVRINHMGIPEPLMEALNDPQILKIGVALHDDLKDLSLVGKIDPKGFIDLQSLVGEYGIESKGLEKLSAIILKFRISKSQQTSNWENQVLTQAQLNYAATDAWVCYEIYQELMKEG